MICRNMDAERDERGRFSDTVSDDEILEILTASDAPVLTASDIADELPIRRRAVILRLKQFREDGVVESRKVGGSAVVWWYTDD